MFTQLCKRYLKKANADHYDVDSALDITSGIELCQSNHYDCIVLDYKLPDGTGTQMLQSLNESMGCDAVPPAIILTASTGGQAATDAIRSDARDFIVKSDITPSTITYAIKSARHKAQLERELRQKYNQLQQSYLEQQKKTEEIKRFYHTVSHEVKTPVTAMLEFVNLLNDEIAGPLNDEQHTLLQYTHECCETIVQHFDGLLDVARLDTNKIQLDMKTHSPVELIQFCVAGAQGLAKEKKILLQCYVDPELPDCLFDARRIRQVFSNLIENAIKFSSENGNVTVEGVSCEQGNYIEICVCDTGCGIPDTDQENVFDRLYQVQYGTEHTASSGGLGLGLSIAREITKLHHGEIRVESVEGEGATFRVRLPVCAVNNPDKRT